MVYLHVTFSLEAQDAKPFENYYAEVFWPVIREHGFRPVGIWKTLVGRAGEVTEIWAFDSLADYEAKWRALMTDPRLDEIFATTGPMVKQEQFKLMEMLPFVEAELAQGASGT